MLPVTALPAMSGRCRSSSFFTFSSLFMCLTVETLGSLALTSTCDLREATTEVGASLLQTKSTGSGAKVSNKVFQTPSSLPPELQQLGLQTFGSEAMLEKVVTEAALLTITYAGVPMTLRILKDDTAEVRLGKLQEDGAEYGLDNLLEMRDSDQDMLNMIDMGGNYGAVTIAVYNKFLGKLRAVVVEPMANTYFFMRWNMFLNGVDYMSKEEFLQNPSKPGVVAIHGAVTAADGVQLQMCSHPAWSMNAQSPSINGNPCDCSIWTCTSVQGVSPDNLLGHFGDQKISLLKMDCEGCEKEALPALAKYTAQIKRFVGELHTPEEHLIDIACSWDTGKYFTKVCRTGEAAWDSNLELRCGDQTRPLCTW